MILLSPRVENQMVEKFIGYDFIIRCKIAVETTKHKWASRTGKSRLNDERAENKKDEGLKERSKNLMLKELVEYANLLTAKCTTCLNHIARASHLNEIHNIQVPNAVELWDQLNNIFSYKSRTGTNERRIDRKMTINVRSEVTRDFLQIVTSFLNESLKPR